MKIGICAIVSPLEIPYLREWFDHHHEMGVNDFILFLNDWSTTDMVVFNRLFCREMNDGVVKAYKLNGVAMQMPAYNAGTIIADQHNLDWCAFIDIDEFLTIRSDRTLEDILSEFNDISSLVLRWRLFSSGGQETVPVVDGRKNFSVSRFTKCCPHLEELTKQFINLGFMRANGIHIPHWANPHYSSLMGGVDQKRRFQQGGRTSFTDEVDELELNHYWSKSHEECRERRALRRVYDGQPTPDVEETYQDQLRRCTIDETELHWRQA